MISQTMLFRTDVGSTSWLAARNIAGNVPTHKNLAQATDGRRLTNRALLVTLAMLGVAIWHDATAVPMRFSYTFNSGWAVHGSFVGDVDGNFVRNLSAIQLEFSCPFPSCLGPSSSPDGLPIYMMGWNYTTHFWDKAIAPVVSFQAELNNFQFINQPNYPPDFDPSTLRYFEMHPVDPLYPHQLTPVGAQDSTVFRGDGDVNLNASWDLRRADVSLPNSLSLISIATLMLLLVAKRKRAHQ